MTTTEAVFSKRKGQCVCGSVKVTANKASHNAGVCHCGTCRKRSGGAVFTIDCGTDVSFEGKSNISIYNSSAWAERGFCNQCGTNLFYRLKEKNQYIMTVDLFDGGADIIFDHEIFVDEKPAYFEFKNQTSKMTGLEVFAKFA